MSLNLQSLRIVDDKDETRQENEPPIGSNLIQQLLDQPAPAQHEPEVPEVQIVRPTAGLCIKTDTDQGGKLFVNLCHSDLLPAPPDIGDEALALAVATGDSSKYRVPMSFSEPHAEVDNAGKGCTVYDVAICNSVYDLIKVVVLSSQATDTSQERAGMQEFIIELIFCQIEHRANLLLNREFKILQKRKYMGTLQEHRCRIRRKIAEVESSAPEPSYSVQLEPSEGRPEFIVFDIRLPLLRTTANSTLDVAENRLLFLSHPKKYKLDYKPQWPLDPDNIGAQFNRNTRVLTVTCQVLPE